MIFLARMTVPTLINEIIELILIPPLLARLVIYNRMVKDMKRDQILDAFFSTTNILLLISLVVIERTTDNENCKK